MATDVFQVNEARNLDTVQMINNDDGDDNDYNSGDDDDDRGQ